MKYPVNEIFYSVQGEGAHVGIPAIFIRLAGCNLACDFCDTPTRNEAKLGDMTVDMISSVIRGQTHSGLLVITGGEPMIHDLNPLVDAMISEGFYIVIETNGTVEPYPIKTDNVYYSVAPKQEMAPCDSIISKANSIKLLCNMDTTILDIIHAKMEYDAINGDPGIEFYLQPIVSNDKPYMANDTIHHTLKLAMMTATPISLQMHKILGVS